MKTLPEILTSMTRYLVPAGWGESNVNLKKRETAKAQEAIAKELMGCLPEKREQPEHGGFYDHEVAEIRGHNQTIDEVRARLTAFIGKEKR